MTIDLTPAELREWTKLSKQFHLKTHKGIEVRYAGDDKLDEVIAGNVKFFHLEYMDDNRVWIGLDLGDGRTVHINLSTKRRAHIEGRVEILDAKEKP